jgi:hypothetical protein
MFKIGDHCFIRSGRSHRAVMLGTVIRVSPKGGMLTLIDLLRRGRELYLTPDGGYYVETPRVLERGRGDYVVNSSGQNRTQ